MRSVTPLPICWLILLVATGACPGAGTTKPASMPSTWPADIPRHVDALVAEEMASQHIAGLSVAVMQRGNIVMATGYGMANLELQVPATPETVYQIQSITKQFTATAIMMLVEEGKIDLDKNIGEYLLVTPADLSQAVFGPPKLPASWDKITVRHLLTHTSGIKDFINEPTASLRLEVSEQDVLRATMPRPLNFAPGEKYQYSNTNYHLLAMMIRRITGKWYGDFLAERIFGPLGMRNTKVLSLSEIIPHRASGYLWVRDHFENGQFVAGSVLAYAGGGIRSTVLDLARWDAALCSEKLLKRASLEQMWTPARLNNGKTSGYGFGWGIGNHGGRRMLSHTGAHMTGFGTLIMRFPDDGWSVVVFTNSRPPNLSRIALRVVHLYAPAIPGP